MTDGRVASTPRGDARARRTWPQRLAITSLVLVSVMSFIAAAALMVGQWIVSSRNLVVLSEQPPGLDTPATTATIVVDRDPGAGDANDGTGANDDTDDDGASSDGSDEDAPPPTFPVAEPIARNFLITGADNNDCIDPDSRFAPAFGDRSNFGERSDTIMVWRVNPATDQVAVLSFPRDLYVDIAGGGRARINTAYRRDDPERLRETIYRNFGIPIDHYIQVDFCAFKLLVDAVGGVAVPFEYPARDLQSGLDVPTTGCFNFEGDHALAYVRSRYYDFEDPPGSGNWRRDGTSDLGRISRQQDFLRRTVASILGRGAYTPSVIRGLIETNRQYVTVDSGLTVNRMLEFAGVLRSLDPGAIASYQIESTRQIIAGNDVQVPRIDGANMRAILAVFRGEATLAEAPEQSFEPSTPDSTAAPEPGSPPPVTDTVTGTATTLPEVVADENTLGVAPPRDVNC